MNEPPIEGKWYWVKLKHDEDDAWYMAYRCFAPARSGRWALHWDMFASTNYADSDILQWEPIPPPAMGAPKGKEQTE